jgi:hypothetical protein
MLTMTYENDGERVLTVRIREATIDAELITALESVLNDAEHGGIESFVLQFRSGSDSVTLSFPSRLPGRAGSDMRHFAGRDQSLSRNSRLTAERFAALHGRVGAAAVDSGLVTDPRLAPARARLEGGNAG